MSVGETWDDNRNLLIFLMCLNYSNDDTHEYKNGDWEYAIYIESFQE